MGVINLETNTRRSRNDCFHTNTSLTCPRLKKKKKKKGGGGGERKSKIPLAVVQLLKLSTELACLTQVIIQPPQLGSNSFMLLNVHGGGIRFQLNAPVPFIQ